MTYGHFKNPVSRTASDKLLHDKAFNIAKNPEYDEYQHRILSMVYTLFDKKSSGSNTSGVAVTQSNKSAL